MAARASAAVSAANFAVAIRVAAGRLSAYLTACATDVPATFVSADALSAYARTIAIARSAASVATVASANLARAIGLTIVARIIYALTGA